MSAEAQLDAQPAIVANFAGEEISTAPLQLQVTGTCKDRTVFYLDHNSDWQPRLNETAARVAYGNDTDAFLDAQSETKMPLAKMFKPVISGVMDPVIQTTVFYLKK